MKNKAMMVSLVSTVVITVSIIVMTIVNELRVNPEVTFFGGLLFFLVGLEVLGGAVAFIVFSTKGNEKQLDERQLKARGEVALYTLLSTVVVAFSIAILSNQSESFPLTTCDAAYIISFTGLFTFLISSDINDAFINYKSKRTLLAIIYLITGLVCLVFSGTLPIRLPEYFSNEFNLSTLIISVLALILGIELIFKGILEKKEALADEES